MSSNNKVIEEIMNKLYDRKLVQRYGTSIEQSLGHDYQQRLNAKYDILKQEFSKINKDENDYIDLQELKSFILSYENAGDKRMYNDDYCIKLFKFIDFNDDKQISIQEFVSAYLFLEEKIKLKVLKLTKLREELVPLLKKAKDEKERYYNERVNFNGVASDAHVKLCILEAKDLKPLDFNGKSDPYCIVSIDGKHKQTSSYKPNTLDPVWNEDFILPVVSREEIIKIEVYDRDTYGADDLEGIVHISLKELLHQENVDDWLGLKRPDGEDELGYLRVRTQLIWSKKQYFIDNEAKTIAQIERIDNDLERLEEYTQLIDMPYGILLTGKVIDILESKLLDKGEESTHYSESSKNYLAMSKIKNNDSLAKQLDNVFKGVLSKS